MPGGGRSSSACTTTKARCVCSRGGGARGAHIAAVALLTALVVAGCATGGGRLCGNGAVDAVDEECDDGNRRAGDGCAADCTLETTAAVCAGVSQSESADLGVELVVEGLFSPVHLAAPPLDPARVFVVEQNGRIRVIENGALREKPFLDITDRVNDRANEQGLLSVAFHPRYEENGLFFVDYTDANGDTVIARYRADVDDAVADPASETVLLRIDQPRANHNGGQLVFDRHGYLWVGMGDGGGAGDPFETAQDDSSLLGKLLRLDVDVDDPPFWRAPADNPHPANDGALALIWAKGLRNPWRFAFDRATGDLWIADVGQNEIEEINVAPASSTGGENYGWDLYEGTQCFEPDPLPDCPAPEEAGLTMPVHEYGHDEGCSITGGFVYSGCAMPAFHGRYFYSDFCTGFVRSVRLQSGRAVDHRDHTAELEASGYIVGNTTSFGEDARGELYILNRDGSVWRLVPRDEAQLP